jgi:hypothetical protein
VSFPWPAALPLLASAQHHLSSSIQYAADSGEGCDKGRNEGHILWTMIPIGTPVSLAQFVRHYM